MRGKVGSEREFESSERRAKIRPDRDPGFQSRLPPAKDPPWCYNIYENAIDREKAAFTLAFWRQTAPERESERDFFTIICKFTVKIASGGPLAESLAYEDKGSRLR